MKGGEDAGSTPRDAPARPGLDLRYRGGTGSRLGWVCRSEGNREWSVALAPRGAAWGAPRRTRQPPGRGAQRGGDAAPQPGLSSVPQPALGSVPQPGLASIPQPSLGSVPQRRPSLSGLPARCGRAAQAVRDPQSPAASLGGVRVERGPDRGGTEPGLGEPGAWVPPVCLSNWFQRATLGFSLLSDVTQSLGWNKCCQLRDMFGSTGTAWLRREAWTGTGKQERGVNHCQEKPGRHMVKMEQVTVLAQGVTADRAGISIPENPGPAPEIKCQPW